MKICLIIRAARCALLVVALGVSAAAQDVPSMGSPVAATETTASGPALVTTPAENSLIVAETPTVTPTRAPAEDWRYSPEITDFLTRTTKMNASRKRAMLSAWKARGSLFADLIVGPEARLVVLEHLGVKQWFPPFRSFVSGSVAEDLEFIIITLNQVSLKGNGLSLKVFIANPEYNSLYVAKLVKESYSATPPGLKIQKQEPVELTGGVKAVIYTLPDSSQNLYLQLPQWSFLQVHAEHGISREALLAFANQLRIREFMQFLWPKPKTIEPKASAQ